MERFWDDLLGAAHSWQGRCAMCRGEGRITSAEEDATGIHWVNVPCPWCVGAGRVTYQLERRAA